MRTSVSLPPYGVELHRRWPQIPNSLQQITDNSAAAAPVAQPNWSLTTGGVGLNKTQEYGPRKNCDSNDTASDMLANHTDPTPFGFWNRDMILTVFLKKRSTSGVPDSTGYVGCGLGSYVAAPPDPATTTKNVVRLVMRMDTLPGTWWLIVHPGDGVSAQTLIQLAGVNTPTWSAVGAPSQVYRAEIVYKAGQYIAARIDGREGARFTGSLVLNQATLDQGFAYSTFVTSGGGFGGFTPVNVRGDFAGAQLEIFGKL